MDSHANENKPSRRHVQQERVLTKLRKYADKEVYLKFSMLKGKPWETKVIRVVPHEKVPSIQILECENTGLFGIKVPLSFSIDGIADVILKPRQSIKSSIRSGKITGFI